MTNAQIKQWLDDNAKTQKWLANLLHVDAKTVHKWLKGTHQMPEYLRENIAFMLERDKGEEARQERDETFLARVEAFRQEEAAKISTLTISDDDLYKAAASIGKTPHELTQAILIKAAVKLAQDITPE